MESEEKPTPAPTPAASEHWPDALKVGQTVSMKLRAEDIDHVKRIYKGTKGKLNMNELLRHALA